jgi:hypothetical protein
VATYDVFISHSAKDKEFVRRLRTDLEIYGYKVWVDEIYLAVGSELYPELRDAIRHSRFCAVVYSQNSQASPWVERERMFAIGARIPVIPIVLDRASVPDEVSEQVYADFTELSDQHAYHRALHSVLSLIGTAITPPNELPVYSDGLTRGWLNSSWDAKCVEEYVMADSGRVCFRAELASFGGVAFVFRSGISTAPFSSLMFSLHGGEIGGQILKVFLNDRIGNGMRNQVPLDALPGNRWQSFLISLDDLDARDTIIFKVNWSHATGDLSGPIHLADASFAMPGRPAQPRSRRQGC